MTGLEAASTSLGVGVQKPNGTPVREANESMLDADARDWEVRIAAGPILPDISTREEASSTGGGVSPHSDNVETHQTSVDGFVTAQGDETGASPEPVVPMTQHSHRRAADIFITPAGAGNSSDVLSTAEHTPAAAYRLSSPRLLSSGQAPTLSPAEERETHALETASVFHQGYNVEFPELGSLAEESTPVKPSSSQLDSDTTRHLNHNHASYHGALLPDDSLSMCHSALRSLQNAPTSSTDLADQGNLVLQAGDKAQSVSVPPLATLEAAASSAQSYSDTTTTNDNLKRRTLCLEGSTLEYAPDSRGECNNKRDSGGAALLGSGDAQHAETREHHRVHCAAEASISREDVVESSTYSLRNAVTLEEGNECGSMSEGGGGGVCNAAAGDAVTSGLESSQPEGVLEPRTDGTYIEEGGIKGHERDQAVQSVVTDDSMQNDGKIVLPEHIPHKTKTTERSVVKGTGTECNGSTLVEETSPSPPAAEPALHPEDAHVKNSAVACQENSKSDSAEPTAPVDTADVVIFEAANKPSTPNTEADPKGEPLSHSTAPPNRCSGDIPSDSTGFKRWYRRVSRATSSGSRASVAMATSISSFCDLGGPTGSLVNSSVEECRGCVRDILTAAVEASNHLSEPTGDQPSRTILQRLLCAKHVLPLPTHMAPQPQLLRAASGTCVDQTCAQHARALGLLYLQCTGLASPGPTGGHWERLGFQGSNPVTDFRAGGVLALAHLLSLFVHDEVFPFALLGINITKWALDLMESGALNVVAMKRASLIDAVEKWYIGTFFYFERQWRHKPCSIPNLGFRISATEKHAKEKVNAMVNLARSRRTSW